MQERRRNPRFACLKPREWQMVMEGQPQTARLSNLSRNGLSLESSSPLRENEAYQFTIHAIDSKNSVPCEVRIAWVRPAANGNGCICGARLTRMDPSSKVDLLDILYQDWKQRVVYNFL